ncbi:uncharacterized protein N0V89_010731 [Didymosphaeria variabile]|uniref:3-isopropylmalate dehydratase n=1 Tax=Didymosphaeria variabile TaxID=1932322 RepID=A0A9W8XDF1_9PLEO|nr:uncharacterized protein N0V89_010731 [Didymosphaeria variabile]KAJ4346799.1 hypothetical protein N0V89_010731 [Didymosphaeria variabile]
MDSITRPRTLYEKIFDAHVVAERDDGTVLLYIDRHLIHEVTSPQAFEGLDNHGRSVRCPELILATSDHNVPTSERPQNVKTSTYLTREDSRIQVQKLEQNVKRHRIPYFGLRSKRQGIVHVIGPELGFTLPGTTIVCGDSHTSTHGAFGALAHGIGTSEVEHVLTTQTLVATKSRNMSVVVHGHLASGVTSKDLMLHIIGTIGTAGGTGSVIEFSGPVIETLSMESRMSLCNMSIEAGARAGLIAPDEKTFAYIKGREMAPNKTWATAETYWKTLRTDPGAAFDKLVHVNADAVLPTVTWGTSPEQVVPINGVVPAPNEFTDSVKKESCRQALAYMGLIPGTRIEDVHVDKVFIGSCTNARIEDFRAAAQILKGQTIARNVKLALAVPGSGLVKRAAEDEGIDVIFKRAGFQWREAGCSLCVGLNEDSLAPTERCASTSNRNFESRQGTAGRTHLVSPVVAAATAIKGTLAAPSQVVEPAHPTSRLQHVSVDVEAVYSSDSETLSDEDHSSQSSLISSSSEHSGSPSKVKRVWSAVKKHVKEHHDSLNQAYSVYYGQGAGRRSSALSSSEHSEHTAKHATDLRFEDDIQGTVATIERANINTDDIFPKQYCTTITRTGLGHALFFNFRYNPDGSVKPDFVLNRPESRNASILMATGPNFGCGSSREHAVWSLQDFGFRCVIAPSFADIFYNNAFKNGLLLAQVKADVVERIATESNAGHVIRISLREQAIRTESGVRIGHFEIPERRKQELLSGIGEIEASLAFETQIKLFEDLRRQLSPWYEEGVRLRAAARRRPLPLSQSSPSADHRGPEALVW